MLRPHGQITVTGDSSIKEHDTISCGHCNRIVLVKAGTGSTVYVFPQMEGPNKEEAGASCHVCMRSICLTCCDLGVCLPLERRIEEMESKGRFLKSVGIALLTLFLCGISVLAQEFSQHNFFPITPFSQVIGGGRLTGVNVVVTVIAPTSASTYDAGTNVTITTLAGTAISDRLITRCTWTNSAGGSGTATGGANWTIPSLALTLGTNLVTITCLNDTGSSGSDTISITRSNLTITITAPTSGTTYDAGTNSTLTTLAGTGSSSNTITSCAWTNNLGGSGAASGTTSWSVASIALTVGSNLLTVTCTDNVGATGNDVLTVTRSSGGSNLIAATRQPGGGTTDINTMWTNSGVVGGIPTITTICTTLSAPSSASAINTAITNCSNAGGGVVVLNSGTFTGNGAINLKTNVVLRGQGMGTILNMTSDAGSSWGFGGGTGAVTMVGNFPEAADGVPPLEGVPSGTIKTWSGTGGSVGTYTQGATVIDLATAPTGLSVGDMLVLYQNNATAAASPASGFFFSAECGDTGAPFSCSPTGGATAWQGSAYGGVAAQQQRSRVTAINGNSVTIADGLAHPTGTWATANAPRVGWLTISRTIHDAGIENLRIVTTSLSVHNCVICVSYAYNVWIKGVGLVPKFGSGAVDYGIIFTDSNHVTLRDSWIDHMAGGGIYTTTSYGVALMETHFFRVENNIFNSVESPTELLVGSMGGVVAHNYERYVSGEGGIQQHEVGSSLILIEGNSYSKLFADEFHGNSGINTYFRNHMYNSGFDLWSYHRWFNLIGNVILASDGRKFLASDAGKIDRFSSFGFRLGYPQQNASSATTFNVALDAVVWTSAFLWGNYTSTGGSVFDSTEVPSTDPTFPNTVPATQVLPTSLFSSARPTYFTITGIGTLPWPLNGPDVTGGTATGLAGHANKTPAQRVYEATSGGLIANFNPALYGGNTIFAASCTQAVVAAAIASAQPGDTVAVPAGTCSWAGGLTLSGITLQGPGKNAASPTIITAGRVTVNKHASQLTKLIGFRFTGTDAHLTVGGTVANQPYIIYNNYFNITETNHGISIETNGGLIASNDFIGPLSLLQNGGNAIASTLGSTPASSAEWAAAPTFGTLDTTGYANNYVEDNTITNLRDGWDCDDGAKMVYRHNTLNDSSLITHGGGNGGSANDTSTYGCRQMEIYDNTFNRVHTGASDGPINRWVWFRGSSGVIATNVMAEANAAPNWNSGQQVLLSVGCLGGAYPRQYQTGQSTQTADTTPNHPIYIAGNTGFGVPAGEIDVAGNPNPPNDCSSPSTYIQLGRDYVTTNWGWVAYAYPHPLRTGLP